MKSATALFFLAFQSLVRSQLVVLPHRGGGDLGSQHPMDHNAGPGPALPPAVQKPSDNALEKPGSDNLVMLSDVLGKDRSINIFAGFTRDIESVSQRLDDANQNTTVLAPLNSVIEKLPRKPWEDPRDYGVLGPTAYEGDDGRDRAQRNLRRFVEAQYVRHCNACFACTARWSSCRPGLIPDSIIPKSPWPVNDKIASLGDDRNIWWEEKDGTRMVC
jgi:paired amphipathic helix protein Sin3a